MKREVLYVDDEIDNLIVFEASFEDDFSVTTAQSGRQALELIEQKAFPIVIADQRMPEMTGSELFEIMRHKFPFTKRLMLTGYADSKAMLDAINQGQVYYFIKKPWERDFLFSTVLRAIEAYDLEVSNTALTDQLVIMDRCATLGRSAAQIAHEMGNQLCMLPLLELIEERYSDHEELVQTADFARQTYERLVQLINDVKDFVRFEHETRALQPISLSAMLHELIEFLRYERSLPMGSLTLHIDADAVVLGNKTKLQQVFINLLKNAAHAIEGTSGGAIALTLHNEDGGAFLRVQDNGHGMTPDVAAHIWEPFFTTKGKQGNGLGLDIVKTIVTAHQGEISCQSAPGAGATFTVRLPLAQSPSASNSIISIPLSTPAAMPAGVG